MSYNTFKQVGLLMLLEDRKDRMICPIVTSTIMDSINLLSKRADRGVLFGEVAVPDTISAFEEVNPSRIAFRITNINIAITPVTIVVTGDVTPIGPFADIATHVLSNVKENDNINARFHSSKTSDDHIPWTEGVPFDISVITWDLNIKDESEYDKYNLVIINGSYTDTCRISFIEDRLK